MNNDEHDAMCGYEDDGCGDMSLFDNTDATCLLAPAETVNYACAVAPMCTQEPPAQPRYACLHVPLLAPVDQLLRSATLLFVFAAWLLDSDVMLFLAFATLCVNMCLCCGKPAVGCWMADILIAGVLLLVLLIRDTGYVVHLVFHGAANATHVHAD
jgi:hypothetical protein